MAQEELISGGKEGGNKKSTGPPPPSARGGDVSACWKKSRPTSIPSWGKKDGALGRENWQLNPGEKGGNFPPLREKKKTRFLANHKKERGTAVVRGRFAVPSPASEGRRAQFGFFGQHGIAVPWKEGGEKRVGREITDIS